MCVIGNLTSYYNLQAYVQQRKELMEWMDIATFHSPMLERSIGPAHLQIFIIFGATPTKPTLTGEYVMMIGIIGELDV